MVAHASLPNADLHECKGASTAAAGKTIVAGGAGTATFKYANPLGNTHFVNYAAPYTLTYPAAYTKIAPTTTAGGVAIEFTESTTAMLTYTGTDTIKARIICNMSLSQSAGANRDLGLKLYKTGSAIAGSEIFQTTQSGLIHLVTTVFDVSLSTNDYVECYAINKGASGNLLIYSMVLNAVCVRG